MFVSKEDILENTGYAIPQQTLLTAQLIIETYVGKDEVEVEDAEDLAVLGRATTFQAIYMLTNPHVALEQAALVRDSQGDSSVEFDSDKLSPFLSPWAWKSCQKLSWFGTRSVHVGKTLGNESYGSFEDFWLRY